MSLKVLKHDKNDYNRKYSLKKTKDLILINTTNLTKKPAFKNKKIMDKKLKI